MSVVLEARGVHKQYRRGTGTVQAVRDVSLQVRQGEMIAVIGPSGSGKSTLLHLLGGLDRPDAGEILVEGRSLHRLGDEALTALRSQRLGFVFQFFNLLPLLTVQENVALPLELAGMDPAAADQRADELLDQMALRGRRAHYPNALSGGEVQRVAVARALSARPSVLLADEPTGNLDSSSANAVLALLHEVAVENRCAVVLITHELGVARSADRILEYRDGRIVSDSSATDARTVRMPTGIPLPP